MTLEDWQIARTIALAQMAATLEAGDRASRRPTQKVTDIQPVSAYAREAIALFDAVEDAIEETGEKR